LIVQLILRNLRTHRCAFGTQSKPQPEQIENENAIQSKPSSQVVSDSDSATFLECV